MGSWSKMMKRTSNEETHFMENGRMLLEELIASCDGKCNPIRTFTPKELKKATNNYDSRQIILKGGDYTLFKGLLEDRPVSIKKYSGEYLCGSAFTDAVVGSQMSVHKNVLKLIGCCLETQHPILVHEFVGSKTLFRCLSQTDEMQRQSLSCKCRMKIAVDIANAIAYLHTALSRPIVNRGIKTQNIILDKNYVAKLVDFSLSIAIPEGESHIVLDHPIGTMGFLAPEMFIKYFCSEKSDVYSFGVVLLLLLTGRGSFICNEDDSDFWTNLKNYNAKNRFEKFVDPVIVAEGPWPGKEQHLNAFMALALRCIHDSAEDRPTMTEVGKELRQIYKYMISTC